MKISEIITRMCEESGQICLGKPIEPATTRDKLLYGDPDQECTGIAISCFASVEVIRQAARKGCNLIVAHESLFWNHGDHIDWLEQNTAFQKKKQLLDRYGICVWRNHDHLHAGIPAEGAMRDGIFYGVSTLLGWNPYNLDPHATLPQEFLIPECTVEEMTAHLLRCFRLNGVRFIGNPAAKIQHVLIPLHIMGRPSDRDLIDRINRDDIHCLLTMGMVDFTVCEYLRDAAMAGENRCIFAIGHFNLEELGMEYYVRHLSDLLNHRVPVTFIQSGDAYGYLSASSQKVFSSPKVNQFLS